MDLVELVEIEPPVIKTPIKALPGTWELVEADYPTPDDLPDDSPLHEWDDHFDLFENAEGIKVGGWPSCIQGETEFDVQGNRGGGGHFEYVFQIDSVFEANWQWVDGGVAYFGRGKADMRNQWRMEVQFY